MRALALAAVAVLALAACGGDESAPGSTEPPPPTATGATTAPETEPEPAEETTRVLVYFLRGEKIGAAARQVADDGAPGAAAVKELLAGPTPEEEAAGLGTEIPEGSAFLDLAIEDGLATVDLSEEYSSGGGSLSMRARIAQVVFTLTQFPTVDRVAFRLEAEPVDTIGGEGVLVQPPVTRADFEDLSPAILVESPAVGDEVSSPLHLAGTANTFEATYNYELLDADGEVLAEDFGTATSGSGTRGTFEVEVPYEGTPATLVVFEISAKDGSRTNVVEIPVTPAG